jgi:hypothetical protein
MWAGFLKHEFSAKQRDKDAGKGIALPDGSFPIVSPKDVHNAISLMGMSKHPESEVKAHIIRRAKAIGATGSLPAEWQVKKDDVADNAPPNAPWGEVEKGDLSDAQLALDGGLQQPEDGPRRKRKIKDAMWPPEDGEAAP